MSINDLKYEDNGPRPSNNNISSNSLLSQIKPRLKDKL